MKSSINLAMFFLLALASALPAGYCQDAWIVLPDVSGNQIGYLSEPTSATLYEPIGIFPSEDEQLPTAMIIPQYPIFYGTPPNPPTGLDADWRSALYEPMATLEWRDNSNNEDGFRIYKESYVDPTDKSVVETTGPNVTEVNISLPDSCGDIFTFYVTAFNAWGESTKSDSATLRGLCAPNNDTFRKFDLTYIEGDCNYKLGYIIGGEIDSPCLWDIRVITLGEIISGPQGETVGESLSWDNINLGIPLELKPPCIGLLQVTGIPHNSAGEGLPKYKTIQRCDNDSACTLYYNFLQNIKYARRQMEFSVGSRDSFEFYFTVYRPGPINATASWTGNAKDLELVLEGPGNYGLHAPGPSPRGLSHVVTGEDLIKGYTWKISIINDGGGGATGTINYAYPEGCSFGGKWNTNFGVMEILLYPDGTFSGKYEHDGGLIEGNVPVDIETSKLSGRWGEKPNYYPRSNAGDFELYLSGDGESFTGKWRYGYTGDWDGDWHGTRFLDLRPGGHGFV